jgi:hypothetical protein
MHCEKDSMLKNLFENIPIIYDRILIESSSHINHHLEVETDMTLKHIDDDNSLFMSWNNYILFFFFFLSSVFISKFITNYPISYTYIFLLGIIITFLYEYIWNKTHHTMHEYDKGYSILRGPYDEDIFDLDPIKNILYMNHLRHHLQKGEKKGNYNVILLGADEWFGYNNKTIDNTEYCKTHPHEKICQICE